MSNQNNIDADKVLKELTALLKENNSLSDISSQIRARLGASAQCKAIMEHPQFEGYKAKATPEILKTILQQQKELQSHPDLSQASRHKLK